MGALSAKDANFYRTWSECLWLNVSIRLDNRTSQIDHNLPPTKRLKNCPSQLSLYVRKWLEICIIYFVHGLIAVRRPYWPTDDKLAKRATWSESRDIVDRCIYRAVLCDALVKLGTYYPWTRPVNTGVILDSRVHEPVTRLVLYRAVNLAACNRGSVHRIGSFCAFVSLYLLMCNAEKV